LPEWLVSIKTKRVFMAFTQRPARVGSAPTEWRGPGG
jgi:hypothetical protein